MNYLRNLFGKKESALPEEITESQKAAIEKLLGDLENEYNIEGGIKASEELGGLRNFGELDIVSALTSAAETAALKWESSRMFLAMSNNTRPENIVIQPHADNSRVTIAAVKALRKLANRNDDIGKKAKTALEDIKESINAAELRKKLGF